MRRARESKALKEWTSSSWLWVAAVWSGVGLFDATQNVIVMRAEGMHHAWGRLFVRLLIAWLPWALATPLVLRLGRKYPLSQWRSASAWAVHLGAYISIGLVFAAWSTWLDEIMNPWAVSPKPGPFASLFRGMFLNGLLSSVLLYAAILLVTYLGESRERLARQQTESAQLNEQLSKAQLNALRRQIEPHFLFNTLNAIAGLVREGRNESAVSMIAGLSDFLRRTVNDSNRQQVRLEEELEFTRTYLEIQKARFAERLKVSVDVPLELLAAEVPSFILQPMVENAVNHGIAKRVQGGGIQIAASRRNGTLTLTVGNDGPSLPIDPEKSRTGVGISNVRSRLESQYGNASALTVKNRDGGGVEATFSFPLTFSKSKE